jgi:protein-disulfide isomerase
VQQLFKTGFTLLSALTLTLGLVSCTKPTGEQIAKAIKENPSLLADAIKKNPEAFKDALMSAQQQLQKDRAREQQEEAAKEQEKHFAEPLQPKLAADQVYKGDEKAKLVIVEYTDFECPYCSRGATTMDEVLKKYAGKVKVTVKHLPLPFHPNAMPAARYFEAVRMQSPAMAAKFHDAVFGNQGELRQGGEKFLEAQAGKVGAKIPKLKADLKSDTITKKIEADMAEARTFGFRGTPSFLVGGVPVRGALPPEEFAKIIDRILKKKI